MALEHRPSSHSAAAGERSYARLRGFTNRRWGRVGVAALAALVVALVAAQLVLPGIAVDRVRDRVGRYGKVRDVHVHALPAVTLLWGDAQEVSVRAGQLRVSPRQLAELERELAGVTTAKMTSPTLDLVLSSVAAGEIPIRSVLLSKRGSALSAHGIVRAADVKAVLPAGFTVEGLSAGGGQPEVGIAGEFLGARIAGRGVVSAKEGRIVVEPAGIPIAGVAAVPIFSDPHIEVESVSAVPQGEGLAVTVRARSMS
jgi:hypothetical protein